MNIDNHSPQRTKEELRRCARYAKTTWELEAKHTLRIADDVVNQTFLFDLPWDMEPTSQPVTFQKDMIWDYMPADDKEFIYQMNRHYFFICLGQAYCMTGKEIYAETFLRLLLDFIEKNPNPLGREETTWRSLEAGIRSANWIKAILYFKDYKGITQEIEAQIQKSLKIHAEYLIRCDGAFHIRSNWGVMESTGLYYIGSYLPQAYLYRKVAMERLVRQIKVQIREDGMQWEQSSMYHNEVLRGCLDVIGRAKTVGDELPKGLYEQIKQMALVNLSWMKPNGCQIAMGDSDETKIRDVVTVSAYLLQSPILRAAGYAHLDYESIWNYGMQAALEYEKMKELPKEQNLIAMPFSGHYYLRSGYQKTDDFFHFKMGPLGGGHGHFDRLHLDCCIFGEDILVDAGRYTYVDGKERQYFKSAKAHNAILVDQKEYAICKNSWEVSSTIDSQVGYAYQKGAFTFFEGGHCGYQTDGCYVNRKVIGIGTRIYVIIDELVGCGRHELAQVYHFNPDGNIHFEKNKKTIYYEGMDAALYLTNLNLDSKIEMGTSITSSIYNQKRQQPQVMVRHQANGIQRVITVLQGQKKEGSQAYQIEKVVVEAPVINKHLLEEQAQGIRIKGKDKSYLLVINHQDISGDYAYIGCAGHYGIGTIMICEEFTQQELIVLK